VELNLDKAMQNAASAKLKERKDLGESSITSCNVLVAKYRKSEKAVIPTVFPAISRQSIAGPPAE
jgi:hypothetical protein